MALKRTLELLDFLDAKRKLSLDVEAEALMAVAQVESKGEGFDASDFPTILFERHKFYKNADRSKRDEWQRLYPEICHRNVTPKGGYGSKAHQRVKFSQAFDLDGDAAMMACSWGAFQELGENYDDYGFETVGEFVDKMKSGIDGQLDIFVRSIKKRGLVDELERLDWSGFARNYNGPAYRTFNYHGQMASAYYAAKGRHIDWAAVQRQDQDSAIKEGPAGREIPLSNPSENAGSPVAGEAPEVGPANAGAVTETTLTEIKQVGSSTVATEQTTAEPKGDAVDVPPAQVSKNGPLAKWLFSGGTATMVGTAVWGFMTTNASVIGIAIICVAALIAMFMFRGAITDAIRMQTAADPDKRNVT